MKIWVRGFEILANTFDLEQGAFWESRFCTDLGSLDWRRLDIMSPSWFLQKNRVWTIPRVSWDHSPFYTRDNLWLHLGILMSHYHSQIGNACTLSSKFGKALHDPKENYPFREAPGWTFSGRMCTRSSLIRKAIFLTFHLWIYALIKNVISTSFL